MSDNLVDTTLTRQDIERETEKAYLFRIGQGVTNFNRDHMVWVPKSCVMWIAEGNFAESAHVPQWIARKFR